MAGPAASRELARRRGGAPRTCPCAVLRGGAAGQRRDSPSATAPCGRSRPSRSTRRVPLVGYAGRGSVGASPERVWARRVSRRISRATPSAPGVWNTRGPSEANRKKGTSGACCQGAGRRAVALLLDAIHAILVYSQSAEELLRRRKVHRDVIFKYLAAQGVVIPPATEKHNLIQYAKDFWQKQSQLKWKETPEPVTKTEDIRFFQQPVKEDKKTETVDFRRLGEEFCHWFFGLLNSQNPLLGPPQDEWGPQHFWHDVKLRFYYNTSEQNVIDYHGAEIVSLRLLSLIKEEFLFLSPNLDSRGLKCASSPHGLVMVGVAGTVHRGNTCLGIFEQIFGLIRCPFVENTWKIKFINLRIVGENSLAPGALLKPAITFEQSDLEAFYNVITLCGTNEVRLNIKEVLESGTGDQGLRSGSEAMLNKRELSLSNPLRH
ncbi:uncharacterized protein C3orf38 homolog [Carlito syrichta]|uniref:Uncharacterized protein C3orf38 homolog n=1 Tax=Carlito syrichta TaxID=1868482 RepID=A0A1U7U2M4_CARSF|nr:uncharacterized protein C3orf38 homolog [Carlito syrichta]